MFEEQSNGRKLTWKVTEQKNTDADARNTEAGHLRNRSTERLLARSDCQTLSVSFCE